MTPPRKILVIQLRRLGDVVLTTPALETLRRAYPEARIDFLVEPPGDQLVRGHPGVDRVLKYERSRPLAWLRRLWKEGYDLAVDFLGNPRSALLTWATRAPLRAGPGHVFHSWAYNRRFPPPSELYAADLKVRFLREALRLPTRNGDAVPPRPRLVLSPEDRQRAEEVLEDLGLARVPLLVGIAPFHRRITRRWPARHWRSLLEALRGRRPDLAVLLFWGPGELEWVEPLAEGLERARLIPETGDLRLVAGLLKRCQVLAACDNGLKNMAVALEVPTLTVFGATRPAAWNPPDANPHPWVRREELFCIGCNLNRCPYHLECMEGLAPERVLEKLEGLLERSAVARH